MRIWTRGVDLGSGTRSGNPMRKREYCGRTVSAVDVNALMGKVGLPAPACRARRAARSVLVLERRGSGGRPLQASALPDQLWDRRLAGARRLTVGGVPRGLSDVAYR